MIFDMDLYEEYVCTKCGERHEICNCIEEDLSEWDELSELFQKAIGRLDLSRKEFAEIIDKIEEK